MRVIVELHCHRIPKTVVYKGYVRLHSERGSLPEQYLSLPFDGKELEEVAVWLHHMVRMLAAARMEFCVRMFQKAPGSAKAPVAMDLSSEQVNKIYHSLESAQVFFAPQIRTRKEGPTGVVEKV